MPRWSVRIVNTGYPDYAIEKKILAEVGADVTCVDSDCINESQVIEAAREADAVLFREAPLTKRVIDSLKRCRVIARYGVGVDNIDLEAAAARQIYVTNVPEYCTEEVSDHTLALILNCLRKLTLRDRMIRKGFFESNINDSIHRSKEKVLGLIGYGKIAQAVHRKWVGFSSHPVLITTRNQPTRIIPETQVRFVDINSLLSAADIISLHLPLTPQTRHLLSTEAFDRMKPGALLVNTSRGGLVDESALIEALNSARLAAAGLDVFENEPLEFDHPLTRFSNVVLSSHVAWYSKEATVSLQTEASQEVAKVLSGRRPMNWVNRWAQ